jgi:PmbA protein
MDDLMDLAEDLVKKATGLGAQDAIADVYRNRNFEIRFSQNQVDIANTWRETAGWLFVAVDRRIVFTEVKDFTKWEKVVDDTIKVARKSQENEEYSGIAAGPFQYHSEKPDPKIVQLEDAGGLVDAGIEAALKAGATETAGSFWRNEEEHHLATSGGVRASRHAASLYYSIRALRSPDESGHGIECATTLHDFKPERAGRKAGEIAKQVNHPEQGEAGKHDVIFDTLFLGSLADQIVGRAGAFTVLAGLSPLKDKVGQKIAHEGVTLYDDATARSNGSRPWDDEGVPTRKTAVVEKGVLKTYLHNTSTAKLFKTGTTGNAGLVAPTSYALAVEPGDRTKEELFAEVRDGLYVTNTWYSRYQSYVTGDFSTIPRDGIFKIKNGEIAGSVKDLRLTDNILGVWQRMEALSKDRQEVMWWGEVSVPSLVPYGLARQVGFTKSSM